MTHAAHPRILQVITHLDMGGAEMVAISLAEQLHSEFNFSFFAVGGMADNPVGQEMARRLSQLNIPVHNGTAIGFKRGGAAQAGLRLHQLIWKTRPDVVHLHTEVPETVFVVASLLGLPRKLQVIRTIHNSELWPAWGTIGQVVERRLSSVKALAVGVSSACLQGLWEFQSARGLVPTPESRTQVVYNGIVTDGQAVPRPQRIPADRPVRVLFAARLEPQKGADLLPEILTAASVLTDRLVDITVLGHGSLEGMLQDWMQTQTLPWTIRLGDPVANLAEHLGEYDLMLVSSRFEGLCLVAIEALVAGMPVVATRIRGLDEVFPPDYPLLCESEDISSLAHALARGVDHWEQYANFVATHRPETIQKFNLGRMAQGYRASYWSALQPVGTEVDV